MHNFYECLLAGAFGVAFAQLGCGILVEFPQITDAVQTQVVDSWFGFFAKANAVIYPFNILFFLEILEPFTTSSFILMVHQCLYLGSV
jgi:hypothetical protein